MSYFVLTLYLHLSGKLNQYINLHYSYLAYITMVLSLLLAIVQAYICFKRLKEHSHLHSFSAKLASFVLLSLPLLVGFTFPTVTLDSQTVSAKGYYFPLSEGTDKAIQASEGTSSQFLKPDTSRFYSQTAHENIIQKSADKYLAKSSIVIKDENYLEVMELSMIIQMNLKARKSSLLALSTTIQIIPIVNLFFALVSCTVSLIQEFLAS